MQMSITRALAELKLLKSRIKKSTNQEFISYYIKMDGLPTGQTEETYKTKLSANLQSARDLINRSKEIKDKIVLSNAVTKVKIGSKEYTVAEAIERKRSIQYDKELLKNIQSALQMHRYSRENQNDKIEAEVSKQTLSKSDRTFSPEYVEKEVEVIKERLKFIELDPNDLEKFAKDLESEIEEFETEVDYVLSTSNTTTMIEVSE